MSTTVVSSSSLLADAAQQGLVARLSVVKAADAAVLASTNFTFFDCHQLHSCQLCASARFPCDWCALSARCVPNAEDVCQGETLVNSVSVSCFKNIFFYDSLINTPSPILILAFNTSKCLHFSPFSAPRARLSPRPRLLPALQCP
jgi:hypothetical protein